MTLFHPLVFLYLHNAVILCLIDDIVDDNIQNKDLHYCQVCEVVNVSEEHIRTHQNETEEPKVTLYICDICDSQFDQEDNLKEHVSDIHNNKVDEKYSPSRRENNELIYQIGTHFMAFEENESMEINQDQDDIKTGSSSPEDVHKGQRKSVQKTIYTHKKHGEHVRKIHFFIT